MTITHKLSKQEQVNPMELDIVQKREIPTLLPIQLISSFSGIKLRFTITQEVRVIDYLGSGITFGQFLQAVRQVVKTILACQARGISVNNLELEDSFLFLDFQTCEMLSHSLGSKEYRNNTSSRSHIENLLSLLHSGKPR